ncbi:ferredoxin [Streptomyces sp. NBC_00669]|uniref:ferredoxin n=1 Tax=unclassified Streptomyces TaxID=2593676 RepID=UPI002E247CAA|nr:MULTISPECIES: ferredoxin [unclassified Streptomyces]
MRVHVDHERCVGSGSCVFSDPSVFSQDDEDGRVVLLIDPHVDPDRRQSVRDAAFRCPVGAITVAE